MDEAYRPIAQDLQRVLPHKYEVSDVTPITLKSETGEVQKVGSETIAQQMGLWVSLRDEYRQEWWQNEQPTVVITFPKSYVQEPSCVPLLLAPRVEEAFKDIIPKPQAEAKKKAQEARASKKKKTTRA